METHSQVKAAAGKSRAAAFSLPGLVSGRVRASLGVVAGTLGKLSALLSFRGAGASAGDRPASGAAGWSSPVARQAHNLKVVGSNPTPATKKKQKALHMRRSSNWLGSWIFIPATRIRIPVAVQKKNIKVVWLNGYNTSLSRCVVRVRIPV